MRILTSILILFIFFLPSLSAKEITDMAGRKVEVPDIITRVYSSSPPPMCMIYAVDPDLLVGLNMSISEGAKPYLKKSFTNLPVLGGSSGHGAAGPILNIETILKTNPDIVVTWTWEGMTIGYKSDGVFNKMKIPIVVTTLDRLSGYGETFFFYGKLLNREKRCAELAEYTNRILSETEKFVSLISESKKPAVYYAEGNDGLSTECDSSIHCELIPMAGGRNVNKCISKELVGMNRINIEQVMVFNPDIILVQDASFYKKVFNDPKWRDIRAVQTKKVYLIPQLPFNWFDRPPSFMRLLGLQWVAGCFYPDLYRKDLEKETQNFFRLFLGTEISKQEASKIINSRR